MGVVDKKITDFFFYKTHIIGCLSKLGYIS